ncbi:MAG: hypothetical protein ACRD3V_08285, partial [Vicinamibacteria bacterium]
MNTSRNSSSPHPSFRSYLYLAFYAFQVVLAYSPLLIRVAGPWTVLATFGFLFLFGLVLAKPVLLGRLRAPGSRTALWLSLAAIFFNLSLLLFGRHFALYSASPLFLALFAIPFVAALRSKAFLVGALAAALLTIHVSLIRTVPLDRSGGMLALIDAAAEALLSGRNPYRERLEVPIGDRGFIYVPGLLLAYLPFKAAGVDIRYLNAGAAVLFWLYVTLTGWRRKEGGW